MAYLKNHLPSVVGILLCTVVIFAVVFVKPSSVFPLSSIITWNPSNIVGEVALKNSKTVSVTFTSTKNIRRAAVEISPELKQFVQVNPVLLERIRKGEKRQVQLVLSAAATAQLTTFKGVIQLRKGKKDKADKPEDDDASEPEGKLLAQPLPVSLLITVVSLPPDPGEAGKATLEGIDSDHDGVRDDIQRYIGYFPTKERKVS